jgi:STE24 endopeptidase
MIPTEQLIIVLFLGLFFLENVIELSLNEANLRYVQVHGQSQQIPELFRERMSSETFLSSVKYTVAKGNFERWSLVYGSLVKLFVLFGGVLAGVNHFSLAAGSLFPLSTQATGITFCLVVSLLLSVLSLPPDLYYTFVLEERFGFNKTSFNLFLLDKLKALVVGLVIGVPFLFVVLSLMQAAGPYWWVYGFVFILAFQLLMVLLYPTLIAPLFNKFTPLQDGELRRRILELATQLGFQTSGIFTMDGSRRSAHSNAYFTGLGRSKRIVFFDTLLKEATIDQTVAVLAHEIGHYKLKHIRKRLILQTAFLLAGLYVISLLVDYEPFFRAFGLEKPTHHGALVLFALVSSPFTFFLNPLLNHVSRKHEYEADRYAVQELRNGKPMAEALMNLSATNLSNLTPHPWYSAYHYSHPTVTERIQAIHGLETASPKIERGATGT